VGGFADGPEVPRRRDVRLPLRRPERRTCGDAPAAHRVTTLVELIDRTVERRRSDRVKIRG
jgi:hypothetical protein